MWLVGLSQLLSHEMKNLLFFFFALPFLAIGQAEKGVTPLSTSSTVTTDGVGLRPVTYAVVVGISDYQDKDIPDLRFADKDAEAFANFLRSPAGGSLDGEAGAGRWQVFRYAFDEAHPGRKRAVVRAIEANGATQPETAAWNPGGYFWNGWHAVSWEVVA